MREQPTRQKKGAYPGPASNELPDLVANLLARAVATRNDELLQRTIDGMRDLIGGARLAPEEERHG